MLITTMVEEIDFDIPHPGETKQRLPGLAKGVRSSTARRNVVWICQFSSALLAMSALGWPAQAQSRSPVADPCDLASVPALTLRCVLFAGHLYAIADVDLRSEVIAVTSALDSKQQTLSVIASTFASHGDKPLLVTNAGIYSGDNHPLGLLISPEGRVQDVNTDRGQGNFFWDSAIFQILDDNTASIVTAQSWHDSLHIVAATQSGPELAKAGQINSNLPSQSKSAYRRTAVGIDQADTHIV
ncbi:MAG: phosphodiester glycosidase family protein, partial [Terracidiphilus sp.]